MDAFKGMYLRTLPVMPMREIVLLIILLHQQASAIGHVFFKAKA